MNATFNFEPVESQEQKAQRFKLSPYLNLYQYPRELDYQDLVPLPPKIVQVDAFAQVIPDPFKLPAHFAERSGEKLIYLSMGSMGSIDVELMKRLTAVLAKSPYKCIVSKGPRAKEYDLPENCWGEAYLPQTALLPLVDLVITHGGN